MSTDDTSRFVRLKVELVLEVADAEALTGAALQRVAEDEETGPEERAQAVSAVEEDEAEAVAYLVDPFDLVADVPGPSWCRPPGPASRSTTTPTRRIGTSARMMMRRGTRKTACSGP